jgi:hypothetical protein
MKISSTTPSSAYAPGVAPASRPVSRRQPGERLLPDGSAGAVTRWWPVLWPRIGGEALLPLPPDAFTREGFTQAYKPGTLA